MQIPDDYTPSPGDLLTLGEKSIAVHWVKDAECGYAINYGRGAFEALHRRPVSEFVACCRDQGLSLMTTNGASPAADGGQPVGILTPNDQAQGEAQGSSRLSPGATGSAAGDSWKGTNE